MMARRILSLLIALNFCVFMFCSCGLSERASCREVLDAMVCGEMGLPAGSIYDKAAAEGDAEYFSDSLLCALLGEYGVSRIKSSWIDYAVFLSLTDSPCEFSVFYCDSREVATDTARLFCARLDAVRTAKSQQKYAEMLNAAKIAVYGNYVIMIISTDADAALSLAKKAMQPKLMPS